MVVSLPAAPKRSRRISAVLGNVSASLQGQSSWYPQAQSAIVCVIDGLGARNLAERAAHARTLAAGGPKAVARTVFPATTAAALTSLTTGSLPGEHGMLGYRARVPETGFIANMLRDWETGHLEDGWVGKPTVFTARREIPGQRSVVVSMSKFAGTGFTRNVLGGAEFVAADGMDARVQAAIDAAKVPGTLVYLYFAELDHAGHKYGWRSDRWVAMLEVLDSYVRKLEQSLPTNTGLVVTADHGMVDVPREKQVLLTSSSPLVRGVAGIGGEPRMLHLYSEPGAADAVRDAWSAEEDRSWVLTKREAIANGLFGPVASINSDRIGDVIVAARADIAYYDDRIADKAPQRMVGQHGSLTDFETIIPLIGMGAYAGR